MLTTIASHFRIAIYPSRRRGFTLLETVVATGIGVFASAALVFLLVFTARSFRTLNTQTKSQLSATRAMDRAAESLRNARFNSITIYSQGAEVLTGGDRVDFESLAQPEGTTSRLQFNAAQSRLSYYPDASNTDEVWSMSHVEEIEFGWVAPANQMVQIVASFKYPKYRGYNQTDAEKLRGVFRTTVWPRND